MAAIGLLRERYAGKRRVPRRTDALKAELWLRACRSRRREGAEVAVLGYDTSLTYEKLVRINRMLVQGKPYIATHADDVCPAEGGVPARRRVVHTAFKALFGAGAGRDLRQAGTP